MKVTLTDLSNPTNIPSLIAAINNNSTAIENAIENTLSRDGTAPNSMEAQLDMNSNQIINLPPPTTTHNAATKEYVDNIIAGISPGAAPSTNVIRSAMDIVGMDNTGTTSCNVPLKALIEAGGAWYFPDGDYMITGSGVDARRSKNLWIMCSPNARFFCPNDSDAVNGDFFNFAVPSAGVGLPVGGLTTLWQGGFFDLRNMKNSTSLPHSGTYPPANLGTAATGDALSFRDFYNDGSQKNGSKYISIHNITVYHGDHWESAGGDQSIFAEGYDFCTIEGSNFFGARDLGIYLSGDTTGNSKGRSRVANCGFYNCFFGVSVKRSTEAFEILGNRFVGNVIGIIPTQVNSSVNTNGLIAYNDFEKCGIFIRADYTDYLTIRDNNGRSVGAVDGDGAPVLVYPNEVYQINGCTHLFASNNRCNGVAAANVGQNYYLFGIRDYAHPTAGTITSDYNYFHRNISHNLYGWGQELTGEGNYNHFVECFNDGGTVFHPQVTGANTSVIRWDQDNSRQAFTTPVSFGDGSAAAPIGSRFGSINTGFFFGTNKFGIALSGVERFYVDGSLVWTDRGLVTASNSRGLGYATGAGGTVTQLTSKATAVDINRVCGNIITHNAALNDSTTVTFTVNNTTIDPTDTITVNHASGGTAGAYLVFVSSVGTDVFTISIRNVSGGTLSEALTINFTKTNGVIA